MPDLLLMPSPQSDQAGEAPADHAARARALDTTRSFLVEAPAGSGKTGLLIQRLLKLLAGPDVTDPAQVLAITFTRKATGELRERILTQLQLAAAGAPVSNHFDQTSRTLAEAVLARDQALGWKLLDQPARLHISTIDGVCAQIVRALPVLTGSSGPWSPTADAFTLYREAARRTLMRLGGDDPGLSAALSALLLHRDGNLPDVERHIARMLSTREQWGELLPARNGPNGERLLLDDAALESEVLPRLEEALDRAICRALSHATYALPTDILETLCALAAEMAHAEGYRGQRSPISLCAGNPRPPDVIAAHLDQWRALIHLITTRSTRSWRNGFNVNQVGFVTTKPQRETLKRLVASLRAHDDAGDALCKALCAIHDLPSPTYPAEQWQLTKTLFRVLDQALADLAQVFAERGRCDFTEPALTARAALHADAALSPGLAGAGLEAATGTRLRHLLVDEMQDTSSGQYELIELLTRAWGAAGETVFLVGDPKQSIYLFRQARVERFVRTLANGRLGANLLRLEVLRLTANFRSRPALVQAFNDDFARIFPAVADPVHPEEVPFYPATASRSPGPAARVWHLSRLPSINDPEQRLALKQSQLAANTATACAIIGSWMTRPLPPGRARPWRLAVLVRNRTHVLPLVQAFREQSIPYSAVAIDPLSERPEILDLLALTRARLHPADRTAWLALLRAPWCGLRLADLHLIAGGDDHHLSKRTLRDALHTRAALLSADGRARLEPFRAVLDQALAHQAAVPLSAWVEQTWRALNGPACASPVERANAEQFFALLETVESESDAPLDLTNLTARLERLYAAPADKPGAVEIVTIHGAKGLEWDVVLAPALERSAAAEQGRLLDWLELDPDGDPLAGEPLSLFAPLEARGEQSAQLNRWMRSLRRAREAAERKRLLYVLATRAREELHLFAALAASSTGALTPRWDSLLQAAWPAAEALFAAVTPVSLGEPRPGEARADNLEVMPAQRPTTLTLAASAAPAPTRLERIPQLPVLAAIPAPPSCAASPRVNEPNDDGSPSRAPTRPEGSFLARVLGNTLHTFLDHAATRLAQGSSADTLAAETATWSPRIQSVLTANGLGPADLAGATATVLRGLTNTLTDPVGRWLLAPHPGAASELATTTALDGQSPATIRVDRTFDAGPTPGAPGEAHRWIIDYKTSTHGPKDLEAWLERQRTLHAAQLERYATALAEPGQPVRIALYFPLLTRLLWWLHQPPDLPSGNEEPPLYSNAL